MKILLTACYHINRKNDSRFHKNSQKKSFIGCINILAAFLYRKPDPRHSTPLECGVLDIVSSIDISRLWREDIALTYQENSLLQRSNISIEKCAVSDRTPAECYVKKYRLSKKSIRRQKLYTPVLFKIAFEK